MNIAQIHTFMVESNRIEGIHRSPTEDEIRVTADFALLPEVTVQDLVALVKVYQPNAVIRDREGLNVRVGSHVAPRGGPGIVADLQTLLNGIAVGKWSAYEAHVRYETLHPFTDGNGRSGRALWLWMMKDYPIIGFLHFWYYQSLQGARL